MRSHFSSSTAAVDSFPEVHGVVGQPVTLSCAYPISNGLASLCWGRGECAADTCGQTLVWTDGNRINYRTSSRYQINPQVRQGNASLTIEDAYESDSGLYCCRVEMEGWDGVRTLTTSLQVSQTLAILEFSLETRLDSNSQRSCFPSARIKGLDNMPSQNTALNTIQAQQLYPEKQTVRRAAIQMSWLQQWSADLLNTGHRVWTATVTSSNHLWNNHTEVNLESNSEGSFVFFHAYQNEGLQSVMQLQAEDAVYVIEDHCYPGIKSQLPFEMTTFQSCRRK
ncbi:Predicted gene 12169 [Apodemus speciosus]|uniref:Predicted gene 12169 n=1 Tax=Apodemus speciosus TaxID=105296 RepID=A0ABQ0F9P8_APOSI